MSNGTRRVSFPAAKDGPRLEGVLHMPEGDGPFPAAIVCHPHPQMGGNMGSGVVVSVCLTLAVRDWVALRFNFRGVGESEGSFGGGEGEMDDVSGAVDFLYVQPEVDPGHMALGGFSFGAGVAVQHFARDSRLQRLVAIALPKMVYDERAVDDDPRPKLFVVGENDPWAPVEQLREYVARLRPPKELTVVPGAGHLFDDQESEVARRVAEWLKE